MSSELERALLAAPAVEATAPNPDEGFRASHQLPSSPAHDTETIQHAIDRGRRHQRIRTTRSRLSSLETTPIASALSPETASKSSAASGSDVRRKACPCALAVTGAALQLLCWSAAYGFDVQLLQQEEFRRHYDAGSSLLDLAVSAVFQLGWVLGALCICRVRTRGFRLSMAVLLLASIAGVLKLALLLTVPPVNEHDGSGSSAQVRATRRHDATLAMAVLAIIVPASEVALLRRLRSSVLSASSADYRWHSRAGSGFTRAGRDEETFSVTDPLPVRWHEEDGSCSEDEEAGTTAEQQRWLRGASLRASRDKKRPLTTSADSGGMSSAGATDGDFSGSVGWGLGLDADADEAEDGALQEAEAKLEAKLEAKRLRSSRPAKYAARQHESAAAEPPDGARPRSNSGSKSSKRGKRTKEGLEQQREKNRDDSRKLSRNASHETALSAGAAVAAARSAARDSAEFLATPARPKKGRPSQRAGTTATAAALDSSIPVDAEKKQSLKGGKSLPQEYATLVNAWAAGGMELQWRNSSGDIGSDGGSQESLAIGLPELRALVCAAFDAVTGTEGWEERSNKALESVDSKHRTELLTSTICLVERAVRSKTITSAAKNGGAAAVLEERMLPVGFPRNFVMQLALCLEQCFENRRMQRKARKPTGKASQRLKMPAELARCAPPPPPLDPPLTPGLPTEGHLALDRAASTAPVDPAAPKVLDHRRFGGIALPGFEQRLPPAIPDPVLAGARTEPQSGKPLSKEPIDN